MVSFIGGSIGGVQQVFPLPPPDIALVTFAGKAETNFAARASARSRVDFKGLSGFTAVVPQSPSVTSTWHNAPTTERYTALTVKDDAPPSYCLFYIPMPKPVENEIWDISAEVHATNDDIRARGYGLHLTTEIRVGPDTGNDRDGVSVVIPSGSFNIGVEAHHGLILRRGLYQWTQGWVNYVSGWSQVYIKFIVWAGSTQAQSGDKCDITSGRGHLRCLRIVQ